MEKKMNKMKRNINVVNNVMPVHTTSGKNIHLEIDPVEIKNESVNIEMKDCDVRVQPIKLKLKGDNVRLPENIRIGHAEVSIEMCGMEMSKNAMDDTMNLWQVLGNGLFGLIQSNIETDEKEEEDQEKDEPEKAEQEFDPIKE